MASQSKLTKERNQKIVLELASQPGNNACADCKSSMPRWASANLGIFICVNCATIHRKIGTHVTKVKSLTLDEWTKDQVDHMKSVGNIRSNAIYNPNELRFPPPPNIEDPERDSEMEHYVRAKYQYKRFVDKHAFVASRLGPSASAGSRSVSSPVTKPVPQQDRAPPPARHTAPAPKAEPQVSKPAPPALPSTAFSSGVQPRSVSQPLTSQSANGASAPAAPTGGVWNDISLINQSVNASLPLQYQAPQATGLPQSASMPMFSLNSTMPQSATLPAFSSAPTLYGGMTGGGGLPAGMLSPGGTGINGFAPNGFPQQLNLQQPTGISPFFQSSNPQQQIATPTAMYSPSPQTMGGMTLTPSPNQFISVPGQNQFLSPSPSQQFFSASPSQHQQFLSPSPAQQHMSMTQIGTPSPYPSTPSSAVPTGGFLGMTTMQMEQQRHMQQQQQNHQQQQMQMQMQMQVQAQAQAQAQAQFQFQQQQQQQQQQMFMQQQAYGAPQWGAM